MTMDRDALVSKAAALVGEFELTKPSITAGGIGAALETAGGMFYTGINLDLACGIGFCAEHSAVAEMLKSRETVVRRIVAVNEERIVAPCGRCREMLVQVDARNLDCEVTASQRRVRDVARAPAVGLARAPLVRKRP